MGGCKKWHSLCPKPKVRNTNYPPKSKKNYLGNTFWPPESGFSWAQENIFNVKAPQQDTCFVVSKVFPGHLFVWRPENSPNNHHHHRQNVNALPPPISVTDQAFIEKLSEGVGRIQLARFYSASQWKLWWSSRCWWWCWWWWFWS